MVITIPSLVPDNIAEQMVADIAELNWHAGDTSDPEYAARVKKNEELKEKDNPLAERYLRSILGAIMTNEEFKDRAFPYKAKTPQFNRYSGGGTYDRHCDAALMGSPEIRTDMSITVFLSRPESYEGGELVLESVGDQTRMVKEQRGTLVCYPTEAVHYVKPVTQGTRFAAVTWIQSYIREANRRALVANMLSVAKRLKAKDGITDTYTDLYSCYQNLLRLWCEF